MLTNLSLAVSRVLDTEGTPPTIVTGADSSHQFLLSKIQPHTSTPAATTDNILQKVYKIQVDSEGHISLPLDTAVRRTSNVIYQFFRIIGDKEGKKGEFTIDEAGKLTALKGRVKVLDGKTQMTVSQRIKNYTYLANHPEKSPSIFFNDMRAYPDEFYFRIRKIVAPGEDINQAEDDCIREDKAVETGYNITSGSNGSNKFIPNPAIEPSPLIEPITPEKTYPIRVDENGQKRIATTPSVEDQENVVYFFRHKEKRTEYTGYTTTTVKKRNSKHQSTFNNVHKVSKKSLLPKAVDQSPTKFIYGVYGQFKEGEDPRPHELHCQTVKNTLAPNGLNVAVAGSGGVCKKYGKRMREQSD